MTIANVAQDIFGVFRLGDRPAMDENNRVLVDGERRRGPFLDESRAIGERPARLGADRAAGGKAEMADDIASGSWYRLFAANFELMASDDPVKRERGVAMLKKNSDRFERREKTAHE